MKKKVGYLIGLVALLFVAVNALTNTNVEAAGLNNNMWNVEGDVQTIGNNAGSFTNGISPKINAPTAPFGFSSYSASIQVVKCDTYTGTRLSGAEFTVYNQYNQAVQVIQTDASGTATTVSLSLGEYTVKETKAPAGYKLDSNPLTVSLSYYGQRLCLKKFNTATENGTLNIVKKDESNQPLANAVFEVYDLSNQLIDTFTTGTDGKATINDLAYGTYRVKETVAPEGYQLDSTLRTVTISSRAKTVTLNVVNKKYKGSLVVIKKDTENKLLSGAVFDVYNSTDQLVGTITTNGNGEATLSGLSYGEYKVVEKIAPTGYELDATPKIVTISSEQTKLEVINKINVGNIKIVKYEKDSNPTVYLAGAVFDFYNNKQEKLGTYTTGSNGEVTIGNLTAGTYYLLETQAPAGYEHDTQMFPVEVTVGETVEVRHANVKQAQYGALKIKKYVRDLEGLNTTLVLAGAEYDVTDAGGTVHKGITDANGDLLVQNLAVGEATIKETKTPKGYDLDENEYKVEIKAEQTAEITLYNQVTVIPVSGHLYAYVTAADSTKTVSGLNYQVQNINNSGEIYNVTTNRFGQFSLTLPAWEYEIRPISSLSKANIDRAVKFTVSSNRFTRVDLTV